MLVVLFCCFGVFGDRQGVIRNIGPTGLSNLRRDWTSKQVYSKLAKQFMRTQRVQNFAIERPMNAYGMGSDIHTYGRALCTCSMMGKPMVVKGSWIYDECGTGINCYFGAQYTQSRSDFTRVPWPYGDSRNPSCANLSPREVNTATTEYLFRWMSPKVVLEASKAARSLGLTQNQITVHIRWADKWKESRLVSIPEYLNGVRTMIRRHNLRSPIIYLVSEDQTAIDAFKNNAPAKWRVLVYEPTGGNMRQAKHKFGEKIMMANHERQARASNGHLGFISIVSLLLAMESDYYVLTPSSNWSRIMDEIRRGRIEQVAPGSTDVILMGDQTLPGEP